MMRDGRVTKPRIVAILEPLDGGRLVLRSPGVGFYRAAPELGELVLPGASVGEIEMLGRLVDVVAPENAQGSVVEASAHATLARRPVAFGDRLAVLDPSVSGASIASHAGALGVASVEGALVFPSPSSGRYYARPAPGEPPFVAVGDEVTEGTTIALLEVMKTFNRIAYGGRGLPSRARVVRIVPVDESDLDAGDAILEIEALP